LFNDVRLNDNLQKMRNNWKILSDDKKKQKYKWRERLLKESDFRCFYCRKKKNVSAYLINSQGSLSVDNGVALCVECKKTFGGKRGGRRESSITEQSEKFKEITMETRCEDRKRAV